MRIALLSDIHANLHALEAVLADTKIQHCTHYICLGDIVGYNAFPKECLHVIQQLNCPTVKGNHDEQASLWSSALDFTPDAQQAINWTRRQLSEEEKTWLDQLPYEQCIYDFTIVHATLEYPQGWHYIVTRQDAIASLGNQVTPICFIGHTHVPQVYVATNNLRPESFETISIEKDTHYIINVGSIGQPRDGNWRAAYCIYDTAKYEVMLRRVEYDLESAQQAVLDAGLPPGLAGRLAFGK